MGTRPRAHVELCYKNNKVVRHNVEEVTLQDNKMVAIKLPQRLLQPWVNVSLLLGFIRPAYSKVNMRIRFSLSHNLLYGLKLNWIHTHRNTLTPREVSRMAMVVTKLGDKRGQLHVKIITFMTRDKMQSLSVCSTIFMYFYGTRGIFPSLSEKF